MLCTKTGNFPIDAVSGGISSIIDITWQLYMFADTSESFVAIIDEPENHLHPELQRNFLGNLRAIVTEKVLKLNRSTLVERRTERIMMVETLLQSWAKEKNATIKDLLSDQLHDEYAEDKEFSSTVKSFLKANGFPVKDAS